MSDETWNLVACDYCDSPAVTETSDNFLCLECWQAEQDDDEPEHHCSNPFSCAVCSEARAEEAWEQERHS